jgi:ubiquinone/menaquinone biosynthesis C-methylase UbiE
VLEIGCGTGSTALRLAPFTRRLLATDVSAGMIAIAREKLAAQPVPQLSFDVADADAAVASQGEYDVVLAFPGYQLTNDFDRQVINTGVNASNAITHGYFIQDAV